MATQEVALKRIPTTTVASVRATIPSYGDVGQFYRYYQAVTETPFSDRGEPAGWGVQAIYVSMGRRHDYRGAFQEVEAPVLVLHGADDLQSEAVSRTYADAFPNARFQVLDSAHFAFYEQPEEFAAVVREFLDEHK